MTKYDFFHPLNSYLHRICHTHMKNWYGHATFDKCHIYNGTVNFKNENMKLKIERACYSDVGYLSSVFVSYGWGASYG